MQFNKKILLSILFIFSATITQNFYAKNENMITEENQSAFDKLSPEKQQPLLKLLECNKTTFLKSAKSVTGTVLRQILYLLGSVALGSGTAVLLNLDFLDSALDASKYNYNSYMDDHSKDLLRTLAIYLVGIVGYECAFNLIFEKLLKSKSADEKKLEILAKSL